jgi:hypothetical protein
MMPMAPHAISVRRLFTFQYAGPTHPSLILFDFAGDAGFSRTGAALTTLSVGFRRDARRRLRAAAIRDKFGRLADLAESP